MPSLPYVTLDVFTTDGVVAGNPLAVVTIPQNTSITKTQEHLIAREFNYSETVLIYPSSHTPNTTQIAIWTVDQEMNFAGHPTVGTGFYLNLTGKQEYADEFTLAIPAGLLVVKKGANGRVRISAPHKIKRYDTLISHERISQVVGNLKAGDITSFGETSKKGVPTIDIVNGMTFTLLEVSSVDILSTLKTVSKGVELNLVKDVGGKLPDKGEPFIGVYIFVITEKKDGKYKIRSRMFFGGDGEDPATGSAACALGAFLSLKGMENGEGDRFEYEITQGVEMGRKSDIGVKVEVEGGKVDKIYLEGTAVKVMEGVLHI